jgi:hypothetical protein
VVAAAALFLAAEDARAEDRTEGDCDGRSLTAEERAFFTTAKKLEAALPAPPVGWRSVVTPGVVPTRLCRELDTDYRTGNARLQATLSAIFQNPEDRSGDLRKALDTHSDEETRKEIAAFQEQMRDIGQQMHDANGDQRRLSELGQRAAAMQKKYEATMNRALRPAEAMASDTERDLAVKVELELNPTATADDCARRARLRVPGAISAWKSLCPVAVEGSHALETNGVAVVLLGDWVIAEDPGQMRARSRFKPGGHAKIQTVRLRITGDAKRLEELVRAADLKALAAAISK